MRGALIAAAALLSPAAATAQAVPITLAPGEVLLQVDALGEHLARPDVMTVTAGVITTGKTAREALGANSALANRLIDAVRRAGVEPRDVRTAELSVDPQFSEGDRSGNDDRAPRILGYTASNRLELRLRDLGKASDIVDALFAAGANSVRGPVFSLADPKPAQREARRSAVATAREEADTYADALGMRVARVLRVSERGAFESRDGGEIIVIGSRVSRTPVEPGELSTRIDILIDYALVPR